MFADLPRQLFLAVVAKDLSLADPARARILRRDAPAEAEAFAARVELSLEAEGVPFFAVGSAVCYKHGELEWVYA